MADDFDPVLHINSEGRIVPAGPCDNITGQKITRLYAWVVQANHDGTAAICSGFQEEFSQQGDWVARADAYHAGMFKPGQAYATAVIVRRNEPQVDQDAKVHWWSSMVELKLQP